MVIHTKHFLWMVAVILLLTDSLYSQSLPIEVVVGHRYIGTQVNVDKKFPDHPRWSFYHTNTMKINYQNKSSNEFMMLNLLQFQVIYHFRILGGTYYGLPGFKPTMGLGYGQKSNNFSITVNARISLIQHPDWEYFLGMQYNPPLSEKIRLYSRLQMRSAFNTAGHIKGYQWFRVGMDAGGFQFGAAANLDEYGQSAKLFYNFGVFIRKDLN
jgi:hypothetical protein